VPHLVGVAAEDAMTNRYREHAYQLAQAFGVRLEEHAEAQPHQALAIPALRAVVVAPIIEETTYAVALHELGHILAPLGAVAGTTNLELDAEDAAWAWAEHHALEWTPVMARVRRWCEGTYHAYADAEREANRPPPKHPPIDWSKYK